MFKGFKAFSTAVIFFTLACVPAFSANVEFVDEARQSAIEKTNKNAESIRLGINPSSKNSRTRYMSEEARKRVSSANDILNRATVNGVPEVLSAADVKTYKKMFRLQRQRQRTQVSNLVPKLQNRVLMGHLISERLLHPNTRSTYSDLKKWMNRYSDQSPAAEIYKLANKRRPKADKIGHKKPEVTRISLAKYSNPDDVSVERVKNTKERQRTLKTLKRYRQKQYYTKAMNILKSSKNYELLGEATWAQVSLKLAQHMMMDGYYSKAVKVASGVLRKTKVRQSEALWIAGFSSYKLKRYENSSKYFRKLAYSVPQNSKYFAQGAYWASKSYNAYGGNALSKVFLQLAVKDKTSFYGQLAAAKLGIKQRWDWAAPVIKDKDKKFLFSDPVIQRVIALSQIGEFGLAQEELKLMHARVPYDMDESLLALSTALKLPNTSMTLARNLKERNTTYVAGLYPEPSWAPRGGYKGDKALVHAVMRQESAFQPKIKSRAGARGLMQLMPSTAKYIRQKQNRPTYSNHALRIPSVNLLLGQDYLSYLGERVDGNLIHVIASYNAGPGNVDKWEKKRIGNNDPVEFVESIPFSETRKYVKHVMANLWMYRARYNNESPDLVAMSQDIWPRAHKMKNALTSRTSNYDSVK